MIIITNMRRAPFVTVLLPLCALFLIFGLSSRPSIVFAEAPFDIEVTQDAENGGVPPVTLQVTNIESTKSVATADNTFENGWKWTLDVTVPESETVIRFKAGNLTSSSSTLAIAGNARYYVDPLDVKNIEYVDIYSSLLNLNPLIDLNPAVAGRQIKVIFEVKVPSDTAVGTYSATYGLKSEVANENNDSTPPVISAHDDVTVEATSAQGAVVTYTAPSAIDNVSGSVPVTCAPVSGSTFALGETTVICSASDSAGNGSQSTFKAKVRDTIGPVITLVGNPSVVVAVNSVYTDAGATASDAVSGVTPVQMTSTVNTTAVGMYVVTYTATDAAGNMASYSRSVQVVDGIRHIITASAAAEGSISPLGAVEVVQGTDKIFVITPQLGYQIAKVFVDGVMVKNSDARDDFYFPVMTGSHSHTFVNVAETHTISATFISNNEDGFFRLFDLTITQSQMRLAGQTELPTGEYSPEAIAAFQAAIDVATVARANPSATRGDMLEAHEDLLDATKVFDESVLTIPE